MRSALARTIAEFGALHGVIHGAGTLTAEDFQALDQVDRAACDKHFIPKVRGTLVLQELLREQECDFCLLVSSLSSILGGLGYLGYSAGNTYLDSFAAAMASDQRMGWYCINWDNWTFPPEPAPADGMSMSPEEGVETFLRFLSAPPAKQVIVSTYDLQYRVNLWVDRSRAAARAGAERYDRPQLTTNYAAPRNPVEQALVELYEETLGISNIGIDDNFFELGGQSLLATEVAAKIRAAFHIELPLRQFLEAPTVAHLTQVIALSSVGKEDARQGATADETPA
jgi:acyl carrier protein